MYLHVIEGDVDLIAGLIHQHGVTVRESCPTNVLTTDTNIVSLKSNFSIQSLNYFVRNWEPDKGESQ